MRNPFYLSYLLAEIATVVMWPGVWGGVIVVLATVYFQWLARAPPAASETARVKRTASRQWLLANDACETV